MTDTMSTSNSVPSFILFNEEKRAEFPVCGSVPDAVARPSAESECVDAIVWSRTEGIAVVPVGGLTNMMGNPMQASRWLALSTSRMAGMLEFSPEDMVVTAQAGITLESLQGILADANQFLPIDAPNPNQTTLGGIVSTNAQGLWRPAYGLPRDRLLGLRVVLADGSAVKAGGKVVKNVAGYDLCKLFAGSHGTLGLITEVTFKTNPRPQTRVHANFQAASLGQALEAGLHVTAARLEPLYIIVSSLGSVSVGLAGSEEAVGWQREAIAKLLVESGLEATESGPAEEALRGFSTNGEVIARIAGRPSDLPLFAAALSESAELAGTEFIAHVPTGIIELRIPHRIAAVPALASLARGRGNLVWTRIPTDWHASIGDVWGPIRADFPIMSAMKKKLDPDRLLSPGRFVGHL